MVSSHVFYCTVTQSPSKLKAYVDSYVTLKVRGHQN